MSTKCLICYCDNPHPQLSDNYVPRLCRNLDVIFILRNIFQVPWTHLSNYLQSGSRLDDWIFTCEKCNELVKGYRVIYNDLLNISRKAEQAKQGVIQIVKKSYQINCKSRRSKKTASSHTVLNITDECRQFIYDYEYQWPINPFTDGDLKAEKILNEQNSKSDLALTSTTNLTTSSYPDDADDHIIYDDDDPVSNDDDYNDQLSEDDDDDEFQPHDSNSDDNNEDESTLNVKTTNPKKNNKRKGRPPKKQECPECPSSSNETFTKAELALHFKDNHPDAILPKTKRNYPSEFRPDPCPHCGKQFSWSRSLKSHIKCSHLGECLYRCGNCGVGKRLKKNLESHEALCKAAGPPEKCPEEGCAEVVSRVIGMETHFRDKHPERTLFSRCPVCQEGFYTEVEFERHLQRKHKEIRPFKCDICGVGFKSNQSLKNHKVMSHGEGEKVICDHCGAAFGSKNNLRQHVRKQHDDIEKYKLKCDQCGKGIYKVEHLKLHLFKKHGIGRVEDFKWRCGVEGCGKVFWSSGSLKSHKSFNHREMEGGKGPEFTCEECGKQFYRRFQLTYHRKGIHESKLKNERFKCEICGAEFGFKDYLTRHKKTVHKIFPQRGK